VLIKVLETAVMFRSLFTLLLLFVAEVHLLKFLDLFWIIEIRDVTKFQEAEELVNLELGEVGFAFSFVGCRLPYCTRQVNI
jgi:hypothetical protein